MTAKKTVYPPETKAAVLAALLEGQGTSKVAADFKLPEGTVKAWRARMRGGTSPVRQVAPETQDQIGALLLGYLHENLTTLKAQAVLFRDPAWLAKLGGQEAAVLHGIMTDKAVRLLEALGGPEQPEPTNAPVSDAPGA